MSHQYEDAWRRRQSEESSFIMFVALLILLVFVLFGVIWICLHLDHVIPTPREQTLRAIADEDEVMMDIIRAINRYETRVVPELPKSLRQDLIWTEESLLKPLEERVHKRVKLLRDVVKELKE